MTSPLEYRPFTGIRRILVAVDASDAAREVLDYAAAIARSRGAGLICVHALGGAMSPLGFVLDPPDPEHERRTATAYFERYSAQCKDVDIDVQLVEGRVPDAILEVVCRHDIDLLIMGTHGRTGLAHEMNVSVAETLVRLAPCPVLSIPVHHVP